MQRFTFLALILCILASSSTLALVPGSKAPPAGAVAAPAPPPPPPTLTQDIEQLYLLIPSRPLNKLVIRYLLNDAEFQAVIRIINSHDAFMVRMRLNAQPEIMQFKAWVRSQLLLSGGGSLEFEESEEILSLFNPTPYWSVHGWQGFINEFLAYFPQDMLRAQIDMKVLQNGSLAQFWAKLKALKPVYERAIAFPESQRIIAQLELHGVDTNQLDMLIRTFFEWHNLPAVAPGAGAAAGPAAPAAVAPAAPVAAPVV